MKLFYYLCILCKYVNIMITRTHMGIPYNKWLFMGHLAFSVIYYVYILKTIKAYKDLICHNGVVGSYVYYKI